MFSQTSHEFGTVAFGAKTEFRFKLKNLYVEDLHITGVRSSCGCTTPAIVLPGESKPLNELTLKTYESGEILATFNTHKMTGYKSATLTVTIDRPFPAEVQLQVKGQILTEIAVNPNFVDLSTVNQGSAAEKVVTVTRTGRRDWKINDVRCVNTNFEVEVVEKARTLSSVNYDLKVRLKENAPAGVINDQLVLVTNDDRMPQFPIQVQGEVKPEISLTPNLWMAGSLNPGDEVKRVLVVRNNRQQPFKIVNLSCEDTGVQFKPLNVDSPAKPTHIIPITLVAQATPGKQSAKLRIETDLGALPQEMTITYLVRGTPTTNPPPAEGGTNNQVGNQNQNKPAVKSEATTAKPNTGAAVSVMKQITPAASGAVATDTQVAVVGNLVAETANLLPDATAPITVQKPITDAAVQPATQPTAVQGSSAANRNPSPPRTPTPPRRLFRNR
ncbi:MAG: DUF1573 domain-containing protein [Pirellulales bacterium]|nr:DUF1573 domain-containing protein [Pirellulales bacterium]